ncbi:MAG: GNAT family N-acetyltransferase [Lachnospiraceae bacterium]|nr:GNAT family N-acetyltransferase [Lachnospiraceae bacterium]
MMKIETERLIITEFDLSMAESVHKNSLDEDNRRFVPDEVFETVEDAKETIEFLMNVYESGDGPLVYPVLLKDGTNVGYVQLIPIEEGYEVGYHIGGEYTKKGYATEAMKAFLPIVMAKMGIDKVYGICVSENVASKKVMEKCGFRKKFEGMGKYQGNDEEIASYLYHNDQFVRCW